MKNILSHKSTFKLNFNSKNFTKKKIIEYNNIIQFKNEH